MSCRDVTVVSTDNDTPRVTSCSSIKGQSYHKARVINTVNRIYPYGRKVKRPSLFQWDAYRHLETKQCNNGLLLLSSSVYLKVWISILGCCSCSRCIERGGSVVGEVSIKRLFLVVISRDVTTGTVTLYVEYRCKKQENCDTEYSDTRCK